jgi:hypothetical protein
MAAANISALVAGDAAAFEQLCAMLMSSQNEQRSQVRNVGRGAIVQPPGRGAHFSSAAAGSRQVPAPRCTCTAVALWWAARQGGCW